jgi:predicted DNA-binding transcriptional regulator YafY
MVVVFPHDGQEVRDSVQQGLQGRFQVGETPDQARYVQERRWAAEQRIMENEDSSIILEMTTSGHWEIARWVLTWGGEAEVLEPKELREMVAAEVGRMARVYQNCR